MSTKKKPSPTTTAPRSARAPASKLASSKLASSKLASSRVVAATPASSSPVATAGAGLVRMGELSRRSGIPASTIKHYFREGLLPGAAVSTARNSALYDPAIVDRLLQIKELQTTHFLPLWRIKEVLSGKADPRVATVSAAVDRVTADDAHRRATRASLIAQGLSTAEIDALVKAQLLPDDDVFVGDDLALAETVIRAHNAGLTDHLSTVEIAARYADNVRRLVEDEIAIFRDTIVSGAGTRLAESTVEAMRVSERLVVLMRRRLLLPTFERMMNEAVSPSPTKAASTSKPKQAASAPRARRRG